MIEVTLKGDTELIAKLNNIPAVLHYALRRAITSLMINLRSKVMEQFLSGPTGAHTLSVVTGRLRRSVQMRVEDIGQGGVAGYVSYGADVPYARIHELGGTIHIPEITAVNGQALHFMWDGKEMFLRKVAAHDVTMPARAPLRTAFREYIPTITQELQDAVQRAMTL